MPKYKHWNSVNHELFAPRLKCDHPSTCHPDRNEMEWRDLLKLQILPYAGYYCNLGGFLHSADAAVGMTYGGWCHSFTRGVFVTFPGTAHRPFPTVSLVGVFFNQRISKAGTFVPW